ncbi:MAG: ABC transporter substrate-binding protein [Deltaproteobacteria bacterium]|jgi:iron complex transport system substrate-binding protein|nr:ABC transporter substrate-binding protein [Deltaproteobacteria bacterium]
MTRLNLLKSLKLLGLIIFLLVSLGGPPLAWAQKTRIVKDSLGREVAIPQVVTKVAPVIPAFCQVAEMLTRGDGRVVAFPTAGISDYFRKVFPDLAISNPKGLDSRSIEDLIASETQVVYGPTAMMLSDTQKAQLAAAGIAVVEVNGLATVEALSQSFLIIGQILGEVESQRAQEFVRYYHGNIAQAARLASPIPPEERLRALFLYGQSSGYRTINFNDISHHYLTAAGGVNVAADYLAKTPQMGGVVDAETILSWEPEIIFTSSLNDRQEVLADRALAETPAVKNGRVYAIPKGIFVWYARSAEGAMLPLWLGTKLYPDLFKEVDMFEVVRKYFADFYNYQIPDSELREVLNLTEGEN